MADERAPEFSSVSRTGRDDGFPQKVGRNDPCPCGSGRKYKKCCLKTNEEIQGSMNPEEALSAARQKREKEQWERRVREGYAHLTRGEYRQAKAFAKRWLEHNPEDDRLYDILTTADLYLSDWDEAIQITEKRWKAALKEGDFGGSQRKHSFDEPGSPPGHAYAPEAWQERYWIAFKAREYQACYPEEPDPLILRWVKELKKADDLRRFPEQREEGLRVRKEALAAPIEALKEIGPQGLPYLLLLCSRYGWVALLIPEILGHWRDVASIRALVEISLFHYPFLSESCLKTLERIGEPAFPYLVEAFQRDPEFDNLKIGLISVAGEIGTPQAWAWITGLLEHTSPVIVNWAARVLGQAGRINALEKIKEAGRRLGGSARVEWAVEKLTNLQAQH
jgi:tetratricopeptide (TPR) repeat protein